MNNEVLKEFSELKVLIKELEDASYNWGYTECEAVWNPQDDYQECKEDYEDVTDAIKKALLKFEQLLQEEMDK